MQNGKLLYENNCIQLINNESRAVSEDSIEFDSTYDIGFGSYTMQIRYKASDFTNYAAKLNLFKTQLTNIYRYFCQTNGFVAPTTSGNYLYLYITTVNQASGKTLAYTGGDSYILIDKAIVQNGTAERTLAHEFMHAIMCKYLTYTAGLWFNESFATMASLIYSDDTDSSYLNSTSGFSYFRNYLEDFIETPNLSLTSDSATREYGALVLPLCIYENHGGWSAIKTILQNFNTASSEFSAIQGQSFNFDTIFTEMAIAILFPTHYTLGFDIVYDNNNLWSLWPTVQCSQQTYIPSFVTNNSIAPLSNYYFSYSYPYYEDIGTVYIVAESNGNCLFNMFKYTTASTFTHRFSNQERIVFEIDNFGLNDSSNKFILMASNLSVSATRSFSISVTR